MKPDFSKMITKEDALQKLWEAWTPEQKFEQVSLLDAAGRVLAEDIYAPYNQPVVRASAMDGIAVRSEDFATGTPDTSNWKLGEDYVRADTGDDFPDRFDAVIAIEEVELKADGSVTLSIEKPVRKGTNVRPQGSSVKRGSLLAAKGTWLTPADIGAIAMGGFLYIQVVKRPRVGFIPTGSELIPVGSPLERGQNYDSNSLMNYHLLKEMGADPAIHPIVADSLEALQEAFDSMIDAMDVLILSAGTSKGSEDYSRRILETGGDWLFHGVKAVPGRPMSMAVIKGKPVLNISGPAVASFYSMDWAVRAIVCRYLGIPVPQRKKVKAVLAEALQFPPMLSMMSRLTVTQKEDGTYEAAPFARHGANAAGTPTVLTADGIYVNRIGEASYEAGAEIEIELLR